MPSRSRRPLWMPLLLLLLVVIGPPTVGVVSAKNLQKNPRKDQSSSFSKDHDLAQKHKFGNNKFSGMVALLQARPLLLLSAVIRICIAMGLELAMDGFLKTIVTPALAASGVGAIVAPLTFLLEYALQPIVHSIAFLIFDDNFLVATLQATGIQGNLVSVGKTDKWHKMGIIEGILTRYVVKSCSAWCLGWAGLCTIVPVVGHVLTAVLTGWLVAWDYVYVPLSGMGHIGPFQQFRTVWKHWWSFQWYGFWAVLAEEIPFLGPTCHVYNVYSAAFFLERVYVLKHLDGDSDAATIRMTDSDYDEF